MKILVIGQSGFLGKSIIQHGKKNKSEFSFPKFTRDDFFNETILDKNVLESDAIILLSAVCRGMTHEEIYDINMSYVELLISSLIRLNCNKKLIVFPSSVQEEDITGYGKSKKEGRQRLASWSSENENLFLGLILPNIFGPQAKVNYASFIATFCHSIHRGINPIILVDQQIKLLYVDQFVQELISLMENKIESDKIYLNEMFRYKVSEVLDKLYYFKQCKDQNVKVVYSSSFDIYLHKTFLSYE
jgi:UDP-2-acetamido-2,6-beta-L-arabino-hexul-4-ose reductase